MKSIKQVLAAYAKQATIYFKRPLSLFDNWAALGRLNWMPDKWYLSLMFRSKMGYWMNWKNPKTFNEKLQWLKIYDRNPLYTKLVDKYEVRKYIADKIGKEYLIPLLGVWDTPEEIDFKKLPNQFVLKCTHDSGSVIICKDKANFNTEMAKKLLKDHLAINYYYSAREWPYKNVKPRIIAEKYIEDENHELNDYKFFCFNGKVEFMYISRDKSDHPTTDFFDTNFKHLNLHMKDPGSATLPTKPIGFEKMKFRANVLSEGFPHARIDFYNIKNQVLVGEITFYHNAGFFPITPKNKNIEIGKKITAI